MQKICCFTGHRPFGLTRTEAEIKRELRSEIVKAFEDGYTVFISGMAQGVDIWAGEIVKTIQGAKLVAAMPFPGFDENWSPQWRSRLYSLLDKADRAGYISPAYSRQAYQKRNEWMVNASSRLIAVWNGKPSGTLNTIRYARKKEIQIQIIKG